MNLRDVQLRGEDPRYVICTILDDGWVRLVIGPGTRAQRRRAMDK